MLLGTGQIFIVVNGKRLKNDLAICGQSYKDSSTVNYDSRVITWLESTQNYDSIAVIYERRVFIGLLSSGDSVTSGHTALQCTLEL